MVVALWLRMWPFADDIIALMPRPYFWGESTGEGARVLGGLQVADVQAALTVYWVDNALDVLWIDLFHRRIEISILQTNSILLIELAKIMILEDIRKVIFAGGLSLFFL